MLRHRMVKYHDGPVVLSSLYLSRRHFLQSMAAAFLLSGCSSVVTSQPEPQQMPRIGLFHVGLDHDPSSLPGLREGLALLGYEEGKNIVLDYRNLPDEEAAETTAEDFVASGMDLIVAFENQTVRAAQAATTEHPVPVIFLHVTDPVEAGYVQSLARPGANLTGLVGFRDAIAKQLEFFKTIVPDLERVLAITNPTDPRSAGALEDIQKAAATLGLEIVERPASSSSELNDLFAGLEPGEVDGVVLASPTLQTNFSHEVIHLALRHSLPFAAHRQGFVEEGALFSYAPDYQVMGHAAARYVDQLLKGATPADMPVEQISDLELAINLKTAEALGLTIPQEVLARADQVIE